MPALIAKYEKNLDIPHFTPNPISCNLTSKCIKVALNQREHT